MICIPIASSSMMQEKIEEAAKLADIIELRIDASEDFNLQDIRSSRPIIVTNRKKDEGGIIEKKEQVRIDELKKVISIGVDYVDIEFSSGKDAIDELRDTIRKTSSATKLIVSYHDFKETNKNIFEIYEKIRSLDIDIIKIAATANSIEDNLLIFELLKKARSENQKLIALCMGRYGQISRILGKKYGSFLTFASLDDGSKTADGQIKASILKDIYHYDNIDAKTKVYGLVGNPVDKSKGYLIHNKAFIEKNIDAVYVNFLVDDLKSFIAKFKPYFDGLSVTMPFKKDMIKLLDEKADLDAVNTVIKRDDKLLGYNTDVDAIISALEDLTELDDKNILVLGAGGVGSALCPILKDSKVSLANRTFSKASGLSKKYPHIKAIRLEDMPKLSYDIIINTTSVGMNSKESLLDKKTLSKISHEGTIVFESIYNPEKTELIKSAEQLGLKTIQGKEMFIRQAALQFELFTDTQAPEDLMKKIFENDIKS